MEGQLELAPGCMDEQVCAGSRKMLGLVELRAQEEVKEGLAQSAGVRGTKEEEMSLITDLLPACRKSSHEMGVWVTLGGWGVRP